MRIAIKIAQIGNQGTPAFHAGNRDRPDAVKSTRTAGKAAYGFDTQRLFSGTESGKGGRPGGGSMHPELEVTYGVENYQTQHRVKWGESTPLGAPVSGLTYALTNTPSESLGKITLTAHELSLHHNLVNGAQRIVDIFDWLEFCTLPWTELGQPPLLHVTVGTRSFYGYIESFDPQITEWLSDVYTGGVGLPSEATFTLAFKRETDPAGVFKKKELPVSNQAVLGGSGGITGGLVTAQTLGASAHAQTFADYQKAQAAQASVASKAEAARARAAGALVDSKPKPPATPPGTAASGGATNTPPPPKPAGPLGPPAPAPTVGKAVATDPATTVIVAAKPSAQQREAAAAAGVQGGAGGVKVVTATAEVAGGSQTVAATFFSLPNGVTIQTMPKLTGPGAPLPTAPLPKP